MVPSLPGTGKPSWTGFPTLRKLAGAAEAPSKPRHSAVPLATGHAKIIANAIIGFMLALGCGLKLWHCKARLSVSSPLCSRTGSEHRTPERLRAPCAERAGTSARGAYLRFGDLVLPFLRGCSMIASGPGNTRLV